MTPSRYNARAMRLYALDGYPQWTGLEDPVHKITRIRRLQAELRVKSDGMIGPRTTRAIGIEDYKRIMDGGAQGAIILGAKAYPVHRRVRQFVDRNLRDDLTGISRRVRAHQLVLHHSATYDNDSTYRVLLRKGISTHFAIQWDGALDQYLDPVTTYAFHVGGVDAWDEDGDRISGNPHSVGFDFSSNAIPDLQNRHVSQWQEPRPYLEEARAHGSIVRYKKLPGGLGYSDAEKQGAREVCAIICQAMGIEYQWPGTKMEVIDDPLGFKGIVMHGQLTRRKSDPIALDMDEVFGEAGCV